MLSLLYILVGAVMCGGILYLAKRGDNWFDKLIFLIGFVSIAYMVGGCVLSNAGLIGV